MPRKPATDNPATPGLVTTREAVVCIHGIWFWGISLWPLRRALTRRGHHCQQFGYYPVFNDYRRVCAQLNDFVARIDADVVHFVCHSLGGLLLLKYLNIYDEPRLGRCVFLGVPARGSYAARALARFFWGRWMLGKAADYGLVAPPSPWPGRGQLGVIAGTTPVGVGRVFPGLPSPGDGTVAVAETRLDGASEHLCLSVSHTSMLASGRVFAQTDHFLRYACFRV